MVHLILINGIEGEEKKYRGIYQCHEVFHMVMNILPLNIKSLANVIFKMIKKKSFCCVIFSTIFSM